MDVLNKMLREDLNEKRTFESSLKGNKGTSHAFSGQETKCRGSRADVCCLRNTKKKKEREGEKSGKDDGKEVVGVQSCTDSQVKDFTLSKKGRY